MFPRSGANYLQLPRLTAAQAPRSELPSDLQVNSQAEVKRNILKTRSTKDIPVPTSLSTALWVVRDLVGNDLFPEGGPHLLGSPNVWYLSCEHLGGLWSSIFLVSLKE